MAPIFNGPKNCVKFIFKYLAETVSPKVNNPAPPDVDAVPLIL